MQGKKDWIVTPAKERVTKSINKFLITIHDILGKKQRNSKVKRLILL